MQLKRTFVKPIPQWIEQAIELDSIAEKLQNSGLMDCERIPTEQVKYAAAQWFAAIVDAIEEDPDWFISKFETQKFRDNLPYLDELD